MILLLCFVGGLTILDKKYYIWLQIIQDKNDEFNYNLLNSILEHLDIDLEKLYNLDFDIFLLKKFNKISQSIIQAILDNHIKEEVEKLIIKIKEKQLYVITMKDSIYPKRIIEKYENYPFFILTNNKINFNRKNIYLHYDEHFTKHGKIGRASCRKRVCPDVVLWGGGGGEYIYKI